MFNKIFIALTTVGILALGIPLCEGQLEHPNDTANVLTPKEDGEMVTTPMDSTHDDATDLLLTRNPFTPQLPAIIEEVVEVETITDTQTTTGTMDDSQLLTGQGGPLVEEEPGILGVPKLTISGLVWNSDRPQAIVNGNIVEVGDRLFGIPTDKAETIPELTFSNITKEGLEVTFMDKSIILKPIDVELEQTEE